MSAPLRVHRWRLTSQMYDQWSLQIFGDSKVVADTLSGVAQIRDVLLKPYVDTGHGITRSVLYSGQVPSERGCPFHVPSSFNTRAGHLAATASQDEVTRISWNVAVIDRLSPEFPASLHGAFDGSSRGNP